MLINKNIFKAMRMQQWIKNLLIFSALIFSGKLTQGVFCLKTVIAFFSFSFAVSALYLFNDWFDVNQDKVHPIKQHRPFAKGLITVKELFSYLVILLVFSFSLAILINVKFLILLLVCIFLNLLYTVYFKHIMILDVLFLSLFFILRVMAGALAVEVTASFWLIICTFMLATFMGLGKRRHELIVLDSVAKEHRRVLEHYDSYFLDQMIAVVTTSTLMSFILYTVSDEAVANFGSVNLLYTTPFVLYGIFRYLYLIHCENKGGDPAALVVSDIPMLVNVFLWAGCSALIIYL